MKIALENRQRRLPIGTKTLRRAGETILSALGFHDSEVSITLVGDRTIRRLNRDYLDRDKTTNVISFSLQEGEFGGVNPGALGDVVISVDTAAREAEAGGLTLQERVTFLLLHGILHLTGFDHERSGEEKAREMEEKEAELFALLEKEGLVE